MKTNKKLEKYLNARQDMVGDWKPDWKNDEQDKFTFAKSGIYNEMHVVQSNTYIAYCDYMYFPTHAHAMAFLKQNEEIINDILNI